MAGSVEGEEVGEVTLGLLRARSGQQAYPHMRTALFIEKEKYVSKIMLQFSGR